MPKLPRSWPPTREDELEMLASPSEWPAFPRLPLWRYADDGKEMGFMVAVANRPLQVYLGLIVDEVDQLTSIEYPDVEAIYAAGWRVD